MLAVISPAKTLNFDTPVQTKSVTRPRMLNASGELVEELRKYSHRDLQNLMGISEKLGQLNEQRYHQWTVPFNKSNAKPAIYAFQGDVYIGLDSAQFNDGDLAFAQDRLRILSGLYGLLRPLDLMQAYRLEMGTALPTKRGKNLYEFWGDALSKALNKDLKSVNSKVLLNLASNEYFEALDAKALNAQIITPVFKDYKNGQYKFLSFFAKKARGAMSAHIIKNKITDPQDLKRAKIDGYKFSVKESDDNKWVFLRKQAA